ncbi:NAD+ synthase [Candidatus Marinamargulisbacteria bacterium SCGC AAA071-K20]|nr:NAD+ synthase [Candidatus Marinamargulisbacteria bacterium SCGC AAA071-K20]
MKLSIVQLNPTIGHFSYNSALISNALESSSSDLLVFSECFLTGYPPKDLLLSKPFLMSLTDAINELLQVSKLHPNKAILVGTPFLKDTVLFNAVLLIENGLVLEARFKQILPEYDVFEEKRFFKEASNTSPIIYKNHRLGVLICEDGWAISRNSPTSDLCAQGVDILINISASPFSEGKHNERLNCFSKQAKSANCPLVYVNQIGSNDELIFDGRSFCLDKEGDVIWEAPAFKDSITEFTFNEGHLDTASTTAIKYSNIELTYQSLVLGLNDYFKKTGFKKAVLGLSGGIDSALTCVLAADALGPENVIGLSMPSDYSSQGSIDDAQVLADSIGCSLVQIPIHDLFKGYKVAMPLLLDSQKRGLAYENIQARIRGNIVMTHANSFNALALATANKSELAVGYSTLYGDMCGALMVLGDLSKSKVYELSNFINSKSERIPQNSITKAPSAELRPNQTDQDSLPDYDALDAIIEGLIEKGLSVTDLYKDHPKETVDKVLKLIQINEYKRNQAPPVLRVTNKAFGIGRRIPIVKNPG